MCKNPRQLWEDLQTDELLFKPNTLPVVLITATMFATHPHVKEMYPKTLSLRIEIAKKSKSKYLGRILGLETYLYE